MFTLVWRTVGITYVVTGFDLVSTFFWQSSLEFELGPCRGKVEKGSSEGGSGLLTLVHYLDEYEYD